MFPYEFRYTVLLQKVFLLRRRLAREHTPLKSKPLMKCEYCFNFLRQVHQVGATKLHSVPRRSQLNFSTRLHDPFRVLSSITWTSMPQLFPYTHKVTIKSVRLLPEKHSFLTLNICVKCNIPNSFMYPSV